MHGELVKQRSQQLCNNVMCKFVFSLLRWLWYIVWRIEQKATIKTKLTTTTTRRHKVENSKRSQMHLIVHNTEMHRIWHLHEMDYYTSWYSVWRLFSACTCFCPFECTVWRACKAPSRIQWYSKLHPLVFSVCILPCGVRIRHPLVFSGTQKLHALVLSVFFFRVFFLPAAYTRPEYARNKKKRVP